VSFVGWLIAGYIAWAVISAVRKSAAGAAGKGTAEHPRSQSQEDALRRVLDALGAAPGRPSPQLAKMRVPADRTAVQAPRRAPKRAARALPSEVTEDHDDEAEAVILERRREVESRNTALAGDDHAAFDDRMRREEAAAVNAGHGTRDAVAQLRKLIVWQEILGRPVGMRDSLSP
jgi:hypothetical protein